MPFASSWMDLEMIILREVSQRQMSHDITHRWSLILKTQMNLLTKQKQTYRYQKQTWLPNGKHDGDE